MKKTTWATVIIMLEIIFIISIVGFFVKVNSAQAIEYVREVVPVPTTQEEKIKAYIVEVFGSNAPKAFDLLSCENKTLDPLAVHDNEYWGQGLGQDVGIFQVNTYWQGVQRKFLKNWKVNIEIAHQIYKENGDFHLWTCGRNLGI